MKPFCFWPRPYVDAFMFVTNAVCKRRISSVAGHDFGLRRYSEFIFISNYTNWKTLGLPGRIGRKRAFGGNGGKAAAAPPFYFFFFYLEERS